MLSPSFGHPNLGTRTASIWCGRSFRLARRAQRYCSARCQKTGRRAELATGATRSRTLRPDTAVGGFTPKNINSNSGVQGRNALSSPSLKRPLNILGGGGYRWPNELQVDAPIRTAIVRAEIGGSLFGTAIIDGGQR
jgi:hypothetical protein